MALETRRAVAAGELLTLHYTGPDNTWAVYVVGNPAPVGYITGDNEGKTLVRDRRSVRVQVCECEYAALAFLVGYSAYDRRERLGVGR